MTWNFHHYYANKTDGLISKLRLTEKEEENLKKLRNVVRLRIRDVFNEAKRIAKEVRSQEKIRASLAETKLNYLSENEKSKVAELIYLMDDDVRKEFLGLTPRFWTQGSFKYHTLNRPFHSGQEMDIDDGTYMPMPIFESDPKIGHTLLLLLVDSALTSLAAENNGWKFEKKQTCGRIKIPKEKTHIDSPMYAIPKEQFLEKEIASFESYGVVERSRCAAEKSINIYVSLNPANGAVSWRNGYEYSTTTAF